MKTLIIIIMIFALSVSSVTAMPVPSVSPEPESVPAHAGGADVPAAAITVRVFIITVFAGMSVAGVIYLTDGDTDNDNTGWLYIAPITAQGIYYLILDADPVPDDSETAAPEDEPVFEGPSTPENKE